MKLKNIQSYFKKEKKSINYLDHLKILDKQFKKYDLNKTELKVLIGPSFSIYPPLFVHDRLLSYALRLQGATVSAISCDALQSIECNYFGGIWAEKSHKKNCETCIGCSENLWGEQEINHFKLSSYVTDIDRNEIEKIIEKIDLTNWPNFEKENQTFGKWAKDILVNNYAVGDFRLINDHELLGVNHIRNLLLVEVAYKKIIAILKPDRVISNDSYYGMWAILESICKQNKIPFYSHWGPLDRGSWAYGSNDAAMNLNFSKPWTKFSKIPMTLDQTKKVQHWLDQRYLGKGMVIDMASSGGFKTDEFDLNSIDFKKPTAMLAANVIWDLAALNKQIVFNDMIDWIAKTIDWFRSHPEFQLIIKPHPAEQHPAIPETTERVDIALKLLGIHIPINVFLFSPKINLTVYDLLPKLTTLLVHTTTVGLEAVALGLPVITSAKSPYRGYGFTEDPKNPDEYYKILEYALNRKSLKVSPAQKDLVYKFILFYNFYYYTNINILNYKWGVPDVQINANTIEDIKPGKNKQWDYMVDSILKGLPLISEDRWMPES